MAMSGTGTPSANEPNEHQTGVSVTVGGGFPVDGRDMGATTVDTVGAEEVREAAAAALREEEARIRADMETKRLSRTPEWAAGGTSHIPGLQGVDATPQLSRRRP